MMNINTEQGTPEWLQARLGKVTASKIVNVMAKGIGATRKTYMSSLKAERLSGQPTPFFSSSVMDWGTEQEPQAKKYYSFFTENKIKDVGFIDHPEIDWTGASPDGLINKDGLIEVKCPKTNTHIEFLETEKIKRGYMLQMQWQMACTERDWCDFVSYDPRLPVDLKMHIIRVERNSELIQEIATEIEAFLLELEASIKSLFQKFSLVEST